MTPHEIVERYWSEFEKVAMEATKSQLPAQHIIQEYITAHQKDGGYDGIFYLYTLDGIQVQVLMEAKLRSNVRGDLRVSSFAKSLIIALVRQASTLFIATNLHFSPNTIHILEEYCATVPLDIQLLNGCSIREFLTSHHEAVSSLPVALIDFLLDHTVCAREQCLTTSVIEPPQSPPHKFGVDATQDGMAQNFLLHNQGILLVRGPAGCGKGTYIQGLSNELQRKNHRVCTVDVSQCQTYKEFILRLLEETLGLTMKLVNGIDSESFDMAFSYDGVHLVAEEDKKMLQYLFSPGHSLPYDYSVVFHYASEFFHRLIQPVFRRKKVVLVFLNLINGQTEVLQFLLHLLQRDFHMDCIIEVSDDDTVAPLEGNWVNLRHQFCQLAPSHTVQLRAWNVVEALDYLSEHMPGVSEKDLRTLIQKFGETPAQLSKIVGIVETSSLYQIIPAEQRFHEICKLTIADDRERYHNCFSNLNQENSNTQHVMALLYLIGDKVDCDFLSEYRPNGQPLQHCVSSFCNSFLFKVTRQRHIGLSSQMATCAFEDYCKQYIPESVIRGAYSYIQAHQNALCMTDERRLEMRCKVTYYDKALQPHLEAMIKLADQYLHIHAMHQATIQYEKCYCLEKENDDLYIPWGLQLQIRLGYLETHLYEAGTQQKKLLQLFQSAADILSLSQEKNIAYHLHFLRYHSLHYQFHHMQGHHDQAFAIAQAAITQIKIHCLYQVDLELCGRLWRYYAVATKELTRDMHRCLDAFQEGYSYCAQSAKFLFGYIVHKNMTIHQGTPTEIAQKKLEAYNELLPYEDKLDIAEWLHCKVNIVALHFLLKEYTEAQNLLLLLFEKSLIYGVKRESIRILTNMGNLCRIFGQMDEAEKKYIAAQQMVKSSGCYTNYLPLLTNMLSLQVERCNHATALSVAEEIIGYMENTLKLTQPEQGLSSEQQKHQEAALAVTCISLLKLWEDTGAEVVQKQLQKLEQNVPLWSKWGLTKGVQQHPLEGTIYDHNGVYLLKS